MKACVSAFWIQKAGNGESEYEDSFWPKASTCDEDLPIRIAVADGATDAVYSGIWADLLVESWGTNRINETSFLDDVRLSAKDWEKAIERRPMPWYVEEKALQGTFAAFLGLNLEYGPQPGSGKWSAIACGDCCVFHLRHKELLNAFPVSQSKDFSNAPLLLSTNGLNVDESRSVSRASGEWDEGDSLYIMSDALACWFLVQCESGLVPWELLSNITSTHVPFHAWITKLRSHEELKNDDCTLVSVTFE